MFDWLLKLIITPERAKRFGFIPEDSWHRIVMPQNITKDLVTAIQNHPDRMKDNLIFSFWWRNKPPHSWFDRIQLEAIPEDTKYVVTQSRGRVEP